MAIPRQVEQQLKEIEEMEKAMQAPVNEDGQTAEPKQPDPQPEPVSEAPTEPVAQPTEPVKAEPQEDWQTKYSHLQGKYNAEIPRLHQQNKEMAAQLAQLQALIEESRKPKPTTEVEDRLVSDKDEESFGSDLIDVMRRAAKDEFRATSKQHASEVSALQTRIQELEARLSSTSGDVSTLTFEQRLNRSIPEFDTLNVDPKWVAWLDEVDGYTGQPRRGYAEFKYSQGDVQEIKRIVEMYKASTGKVDRHDDTQQRQKELERQVQPSRNTSSVAMPTSSKFYTETEIGRLFDKVRQLNTQGKYEEASSLEAELTNAYTQGRVRG